MAIVGVPVESAGDSREIEILTILVTPGQQVQAGESLLEIETDKVNTDVIAPVAGVVKEIIVSVGDVLAVPTQDIVVLQTAT